MEERPPKGESPKARIFGQFNESVPFESKVTERLPRMKDEETIEQKDDGDKEKEAGSLSPAKLSSLETVETSASTITKPFFITRLLRALLPRSGTAPRTEIPCVPDVSFGPCYILDYIFYLSSFHLIWASALGYTLEPSDFPRLSPQRHVIGRITSFKSAFAQYRGKSSPRAGGQSPKSRIPLLLALISEFKFQISEGLICNGISVGISMSGVLLCKVLLEYLLRFCNTRDLLKGIPLVKVPSTFWQWHG